MAVGKNVVSLEFASAHFLTSDMWGKEIKFREIERLDPDSVGLVIFGGGVDINPRIYNEPINNKTQQPNDRRDRIEIGMFNWCLKHKISMFGICRGAQLITALMGGKLIQHVNGHGNGEHDTITDRGEVIKMNSCHHQMMFPWMSTQEFRILASCNPKKSTTYEGGREVDVFKEWNIPDLFKKIEFVEPEVVWWPDVKALCVQGHPEWMPKSSPMVQYINELIDDLILVNNCEISTSKTEHKGATKDCSQEGL